MVLLGVIGALAILLAAAWIDPGWYAEAVGGSSGDPSEGSHLSASSFESALRAMAGVSVEGGLSYNATTGGGVHVYTWILTPADPKERGRFSLQTDPATGEVLTAWAFVHREREHGAVGKCRSGFTAGSQHDLGRRAERQFVEDIDALAAFESSIANASAAAGIDFRVWYHYPELAGCG